MGRTDSEEILESPTGWVANHIRRYLESGGRDDVYYGRRMLLLTTRGRRSGKLRRTALFYGRDGDRYLLVASNGGADKHPAWHLNIVADPDVAIQVGADTFAARARPATPAEKPALWQAMVKIFPLYDGYQAKARREIPLVIVDRV